jgi:hypothetical protein
MLDPNNSLLLLSLFNSIEALLIYGGKKALDGLSKPLVESMEKSASRYIGTEDESQRWEAFSKAYFEAKKELQIKLANSRYKDSILNLIENLESDHPIDRMTEMIKEFEKIGQSPGNPNSEIITKLFIDQLVSDLPSPRERADTAEIINEFILDLRIHIFQQPAYAKIIEQSALSKQLIGEPFHPIESYLSQIIERYQYLDFIGIPDIQEYHPIKLEDIFIHLEADFKEETLYYEPDEWEDIEESSETEIGDISERIQRRISMETALKESKNLIVLGDPGSGKTTLLKYVCLAFAQKDSNLLGLQEKRIPILIRLSDFISARGKRTSDYSLVNYFYTFAYENLHVHLEPKTFFHALKGGECCICLDGLDELSDANMRREVVTSIQTLVRLYPNNRYIATSRIVGYSEAPLDWDLFPRYVIAPFSDDDISQFIYRWYLAREQDYKLQENRATELKTAIFADKRLKELAANPLMLTIIALVHRNEAILPRERVILYEKCVTALIKTWEQIKGISTEEVDRPYYRYRRRLLEELAYWFHDRPGEKGALRQIKEGDLKFQVIRMLRNPDLRLDEYDADIEAEEFLTLVKARTGLLVERGKGVYTFAHLTFQEYLAACRIVQFINDGIKEIWKIISPHLMDPHWHEVILLLLGRLSSFDRSSTFILRQILHKGDEYEDVVHRRVFFAGQALADRVEVDDSLSQEIINKLLDIAQRDLFAFKDSLFILVKLQGNRRVIQGIRNIIHEESNDLSVRISAARVLARLGRSEEAYQALENFLLIPNLSDELRRLVMRFMGEGGNLERAIPLLADMAGNDNKGRWIRRNALQTLIFLGYYQIAGDLLIQTLCSYPSNNFISRALAPICSNLIRTIPNYGNRLLEFIQEARVPEGTRRGIAMILIQNGYEAQGSEILMGQLINRKLDISTRKAIAKNLRRLKELDPIVLNKLRNLAKDSKESNRLRIEVALTLGKLKEREEAVTLIYQIITNCRSNKAKRDAAAALIELGERDYGIKTLMEIAKDPEIDPEVRTISAYYLSISEPNASTIELIERMATETIFRQRDLVDISVMLGRLRQVDIAAKILLSISSSESVNEGIQQEAIRYLGKLSPPDLEIKELLVKVIKDNNLTEMTRKIAYDSLKAVLGLSIDLL